MALDFNPADIRLGPCLVNFDGNDLGGTMEGVKVKMVPKFQDLKIDQLGDAPVDSVLISQEYTVELTLAASASKENWKIAMPYARLLDDSGDLGIYIENKIGTQLNQYAKVLILHPQVLSDSDYSEDLKFYKAVVKSAIEVEYGATKQRGLKLDFTILPDFTTSPARYAFFGDPSIAAVDATAASPVAGSNTGNGTCGSQSADDLTVTETITITCIGVNGSNKSAWKVVGDVTGHIGTVQLTGGAGGSQAFTSDYVNFTITDGTTDFIVGDSFTIATTAANYT